MDFKEFKPLHTKPATFPTVSNEGKLRQFIEETTKKLEKEVTQKANFIQWLTTFDLKNISKAAMDELKEFIEIAEDKPKIFFMDLLRLIVNEEESAQYIFNNLWDLS